MAVYCWSMAKVSGECNSLPACLLMHRACSGKPLEVIGISAELFSSAEIYEQLSW
jgi:hypothetical protein